MPRTAAQGPAEPSALPLGGEPGRHRGTPPAPPPMSSATAPASPSPASPAPASPAPASPAPAATLRLALATPAATAALGAWLAEALGAGDSVLLSGPIGAGKSHLARALIRHRLAMAACPDEDIPSPTFTLVQTYAAGPLEVWHADLYRLSAPDEAEELGLAEAFATALCLVEWPDRLARLRPPGAIEIALAPAGDDDEARLATIAAPAGLVARLAAAGLAGVRALPAAP